MIANAQYKAKQFNLSGLNGISDRTMEMHFKLYEGYVKETNRLTEKISDFSNIDWDAVEGRLQQRTAAHLCHADQRLTED